MRIVHCADLHFNRPFSGAESELISRQRKQEQKEAFARIIEAARGCDALCIAGDLFDGPYFDKPLLDWLNGQFSSIADTHIFISPGNHDPYKPYSLYGLYQFSDNVHIFTGSTEFIDCGSFRVYGNAGLPVGEISLDSEKINILCLHTDLRKDSAYNPMTVQELASYGFEYAALGHVHAFSGIQMAGMTCYAYSGVPFPGGFDEQGEKGFVAGTIEKGNCKLEFVPVAGRQYHVAEVSVENAGGYEELEEEILRQCIRAPQDFYQVILEGTVSFDFYPALLYERLADRFYYLKIKDSLHPPVSYEEMANTYSLKGVFVDKMLQRLKAEPDQREHFIRAMEYGLRALENKKIDIS